jgi:hypothetical protein
MLLDFGAWGYPYHCGFQLQKDIWSNHLIKKQKPGITCFGTGIGA